MSSLPGVGLMLNAVVPEILERHPDAVDLVAVIPDMLQIDQGRGGRRATFLGRHRFAPIEVLVDTVDAIARSFPIVAHGVGLSIGSPGPLDRTYVARMAYWAKRLAVRWYSEHLSFFRLRDQRAAAHEAGLAAPLPLDRAVLRAVARKARAVQRQLGVPFLLENGVTYVAPFAYELHEPDFLNALAHASGAALLLDLHNLYVNARNFAFDADAFVERLELAHVREVHVAGGDMLAGMYTDAHSGAVPEPVWQLLDKVLAESPSLCAVTFEFHESCLPRLGVEGVVDQLTRAREAIRRAGLASKSKVSENVACSVSA